MYSQNKKIIGQFIGKVWFVKGVLYPINHIGNYHSTEHFTLIIVSYPLQTSIFIYSLTKLLEAAILKDKVIFLLRKLTDYPLCL